jgi:hypothetical protein
MQKWVRIVVYTTNANRANINAYDGELSPAIAGSDEKFYSASPQGS